MEEGRSQRLLTIMLVAFLAMSMTFGALLVTSLDRNDTAAVRSVAASGTTADEAASGTDDVDAGDTAAADAATAATDAAGASDSAPSASGATPARGRSATGRPANAETASGPTAASRAAATAGLNGDVIKLGAVISDTGPAPFPDVKFAVRAWFNHVNKTGGINGRRVDWRFYDDADDPNRGESAVQRLVEQDKVFALVGSFSPFGIPKGLPLIEKNRIPVIAGSGLAPEDFRSPMVFPTVPSTEALGRNLCKLRLKTYPDKKREGLIYVDTSITITLTQAYRQCMKEKAPQVEIIEERVSLAQPDFTSTVLRMRQQNRDILLPLAENKSQIRIFQALDRQQYFPTIMGNGASNDPGIRDYPGRSADGMIIPAALRALHDTHPSIVEFRRIVEESFPGKFKDLTYWAEQAYSTAVLFTDVARGLGANLTRESLINALNGLRNYTAAGGITPSFSYTSAKRHEANPACQVTFRKQGRTFGKPSDFNCNV